MLLAAAGPDRLPESEGQQKALSSEPAKLTSSWAETREWVRDLSPYLLPFPGPAFPPRKVKPLTCGPCGRCNGNKVRLGAMN